MSFRVITRFFKVQTICSVCKSGHFCQGCGQVIIVNTSLLIKKAALQFREVSTNAC